jgi:hypothetical protein
MKTKETLEQKFLRPEKNPHVDKPKSLRPIRSMVAVRSLKPKRQVANMTLRTEENRT